MKLAVSNIDQLMHILKFKNAFELLELFDILLLSAYVVYMCGTFGRN